MNPLVIAGLDNTDLQDCIRIESLDAPPRSGDLAGRKGVICQLDKKTVTQAVVCWMQELGYRLDATVSRQCRDVATLVGDIEFLQRGLVFRKDDRKVIPGDNAILTWISGENPEFLRTMAVFLESLRRVNPICQKFAFTNDMSLQVREQVESYGFHIIEVNPESTKDIFKDRHEHFCNFLLGKGRALNKILICDSKDILFQEDPFLWIEESTMDIQHFVLSCSEGLKHHQCSWNTQDQNKLRKGIDSDHSFEDWDVLNGGVLFGTPEELGSLCALTYMVTSQSHNAGWHCTDQASINYIFRHRDLSNVKATMLIAHPFVHTLAAHGDAIKQGRFEAPHRLQETKLFHDRLDRPFALFHQWERTLYKDEILQKYSSLKI